MITIDGSMGEGGGQVLRTSLALSLVTGRAITLENIRAGRKRPGLMRQHLTAVEAAAAISGAEVVGGEIGSTSLRFVPGEVKPGSYTFSVGTAGSATLVFQTVLPALMLASAPSSLVLEGGTHNPMAPPFDFLDRSFVPLINRMGPKISLELERPGFYPAGGGTFRAEIEPAEGDLIPLALLERGELVRRRARALVAHLPRSIAEREARKVRDLLNWPEEEVEVDLNKDSIGPGNCVIVEIESAYVGEVFSSFGKKGVKAEQVAKDAVDEVKRYVASDVPVGLHLADQLLIPLALAGAGRFRTLPPTRHTTTNAELIQHILPDIQITLEPEEEEARTWTVRVRS